MRDPAARCGAEHTLVFEGKLCGLAVQCRAAGALTLLDRGGPVHLSSLCTVCGRTMLCGTLPSHAAQRPA